MQPPLRFFVVLLNNFIEILALLHLAVGRNIFHFTTFVYFTARTA
jgi:hypothetical protein